MARRGRSRNAFELSLRRRYRRIYTDHAAREKPYMCGICNERFKQHVLLDIHVRHHIARKPFECVFCIRRFCLRSSLDEHLLARHTVEAPNVPGKIDISAENLHQVLMKAFNLKEPPVQTKSSADKLPEAQESDSSGAENRGSSKASTDGSGDLPVESTLSSEYQDDTASAVASQKVTITSDEHVQSTLPKEGEDEPTSESSQPLHSSQESTKVVADSDILTDLQATSQDEVSSSKASLASGFVSSHGSTPSSGDDHGKHKHKYMCNLCEKDLQYLRSFNEHMRTHLAEYGKLNRDVRRIYLCKCGATYHLLESLTAHSEICSHKGPRVVNDKEFVFKLGDKQIGAITCTRPSPVKTIPATPALQDHDSLAVEPQDGDEFSPDEDEILCPVCEITFPTEESMHIHLNGHIEDLKPVDADGEIEEKAHLCARCGSAFDSFDKIADHVHSSHDRDALDELLIKYLPLDPAAGLRRHKKRKRLANDASGAKRVKLDGKSPPMKPCSVPVLRLDDIWDDEFTYDEGLYDDDYDDDDYIDDADIEAEIERMNALPDITPVRRAPPAKKSTNKVTPAKTKETRPPAKSKEARTKPEISSSKKKVAVSKTAIMSTPKSTPILSTRSRSSAQSSMLRSGKKIANKPVSHEVTKSVQNKENRVRSRSVTPAPKTPDAVSATRSGKILHPTRLQDEIQTPKSRLSAQKGPTTGEHLAKIFERALLPEAASFANRGLRVVCTICNADLSLLSDAAAHMKSHEQQDAMPSSKKNTRGKQQANRQQKYKASRDYPSDNGDDALPSISAIRKSGRLSRNVLTRVVAKQGIKSCSILLYRLTPGCRVTYGKVTYTLDQPEGVSSRRKPPMIAKIHAKNRVAINGIMYKRPVGETPLKSSVATRRSMRKDLEASTPSGKQKDPKSSEKRQASNATNKASEESWTRAVHLVCSKCRLVLFSREDMMKHMAVHVEEELAAAGDDSSSEEDSDGGSDVEPVTRSSSKIPPISMNMSTATAKRKAAGANKRKSSAGTPKADTPMSRGRRGINGTNASQLMNGETPGRPARLLRCARCKLELVSKAAMMKHMEDHVKEDMSEDDEGSDSSDGEAEPIEVSARSTRTLSSPSGKQTPKVNSTGNVTESAAQITRQTQLVASPRIPAGTGAGAVRRVIMGSSLLDKSLASAAKARTPPVKSRSETLSALRTPNLAKQLHGNTILSDSSISADLSSTTINVVKDDAKSTNVIYVDHYVVDPNEAKNQAEQKTVVPSAKVPQNKAVSLVCGKCNEAFKSEPSLIKHIEEHIREEVLSGSESGEDVSFES